MRVHELFKGAEQAVDLGVVVVGGETDPQTGVDFEVQRAERLLGIERACRRENVAGGQEPVDIVRVLVAEGEEEGRRAVRRHRVDGQPIVEYRQAFLDPAPQPEFVLFDELVRCHKPVPTGAAGRCKTGDEVDRAVAPAMISYGSVPNSNRSGTTFVEGRSLSGFRVSSSAGSAARAAQCGPKNL